MTRKFYGRKHFKITTDNGEFNFTCFGQMTDYGFRHLCYLGNIKCPQAHKLISKVCFHNITRESCRYETVLMKAIIRLQEPKKVKDELYNKLIKQRRQMYTK